MTNKFNIIEDTREKVGAWDFSWYDCCNKQISRKLDTGDYSIEGMEDIFTIERKKTSCEIAVNLGKDESRIDKEFLRMSTMRFSYVICEFTINKLFRFPEDSGIPKKKWKFLRTNGKYMYKRLMDFSEKYEIEVFFCLDKHASEEKAIELMNKAYNSVKA